MSPQKDAASAPRSAGALLTFLTALFPAIASAQESGAEAASPDATAMVGFLIMFVVMIAAYILWIMRQHKKHKKDDPTVGEIR